MADRRCFGRPRIAPMPSISGSRRAAGDSSAVPPGYVEVDFGAGPRLLEESTSVLSLKPADGLVPAQGAVDWSPLEALPDCLTVEWSGPERGIVDAVAAHPGIRFLYWDDAAGDIDLGSTRLSEVRLEGAGLRSLRLPDQIETLLLRRPPATLNVHAPNGGHRLDLRLFPYGPDVVIPDGLRRASKLWLWVGGEVSMTVLAAMTDLEDLTITFDGAPGALTDLRELDRHSRLHSLRLDDAFGLDPASLPELRSLRHLELNGTRRTTAAAVKGRFKGSAVTVSVSGAKSQAWLAAHMDNPFRDWVEDSEAYGRAACAAYTRAMSAVNAIPSAAPDRLEAVERTLRGLVTDLNTVHDEHGPIETDDREHAWYVFEELANRLQVPAPEASRWFDEARRF
ncbi:hypothetical protein [Phytohabitans flavus]|uniref:hypothetical protein n=1 Tax=Phytohabitans flavus TaxID=1076124 RepID=UPI0031E54D82